MATIRKTKAGTFNVQIRRKGKLFATSTHKSRATAQRWAIKKEKELNLDHPLFIDAGHYYCHEVLAGKPSQCLAANRIDRICYHKPMCKPIDKITLQDVNAFKQSRLADVTPTTCRDELLMIRRVFKWYIREYLARTG